MSKPRGAGSSTPLKGAAAAFAMAVITLVLYVSVIGGAATGGQNTGLTLSLTGLVLQASQACVVGGTVAGLDGPQAGYADQTVSAAFADSGENQAVSRIALMVAYTESGLRDLGPEPGNAGSLGLFQQRASQGWGTPDPRAQPG